MEPSQASMALRRVAASIGSARGPDRRVIVAALRAVLALVQGEEVPKEVADAFRTYLEDAVDDYAYVGLEDFLSHLDWLGLLDREPELEKLDWKADGLPFGWTDLVEEVGEEFDVEPLSGSKHEWVVSPHERAALSQPLTDRPDYGTASGPLQRMAFSMIVLEGVTDEMREAMDVGPDAEPFEPGANSAVFENGRGNIVTFSDYQVVYDVARKAKALGSDALPDIYDVRRFPVEDEEPGTFSSGPSYMYAVEMQKLRPLDRAESETWEKWRNEVFEEGSDPDPGPDEKGFVDAMVDLRERAARDRVAQNDLWAGNVAKDDGGALRFIDLDAVDLSEAGLAPLPKAASRAFESLALRLVA